MISKSVIVFWSVACLTIFVHLVGKDRGATRLLHSTDGANVDDRGCANGVDRQTFQVAKSLQHQDASAPWQCTHCHRLDYIRDRACISAIDAHASVGKGDNRSIEAAWVPTFGRSDENRPHRPRRRVRQEASATPSPARCCACARAAQKLWPSLSQVIPQPANMAATNKCLARSNKSRTRGET